MDRQQQERRYSEYKRRESDSTFRAACISVLIERGYEWMPRMLGNGIYDRSVGWWIGEGHERPMGDCKSWSQAGFNTVALYTDIDIEVVEAEVKVHIADRRAKGIYA